MSLLTDPPRRSPRGGLEEVEQEQNGRLPFILSRTEVKLLGIAGTGFLIDAYDLFIINQVSVMLQYRLYEGSTLPAGLEGFIKAGANIGAVLGQFIFGYLSDAFGRKAIYGKELMIIIFATILCICVPTGALPASGSLIWIGVSRIILGIGIGGDYPMSASVMSDRALIWKRGALLSYIFSNQGYGSLLGSIITLIVLAAYKSPMDVHGETSKVDGVWRIIVGVSLIPAFATLYQRLTLPEATRYLKSKHVEEDTIARIKADYKKPPPPVLEPENEKGDAEIKATTSAEIQVQQPGPSENTSATDLEAGATTAAPAEESKKAHWKEFAAYFSQWRHMKILIGTCMSWFLLDVAFYGINLNQSVVLKQIHFDGKGDITPWHSMFKISTGNLIITALGFVPGYWATTLTVEYLGRKWIQMQGFLFASLFLGVLAGKFHDLSTPAFIVCFAFLQFFFNFGANTTTYLYPAEVFPTRFRSSAHGLSAAAGKAGAIISALAFNTLAKKIGTPAVLWIFFGCCLAGAAFTLLLPEVKGRDPDEVDRMELAETKRDFVAA
ncbi:MFS general substrate transporter [Exidia glandulosa HHB12029]|uniref:MFS general substrate transporter n=1 Tax=Exidia glandulosa HHB12029 TaxID=1314781 RepID=A0A165DLL2_EXIGL|nr:MFS general substrate transporter [Exidia glandulosa HHB12029]